MHCYNFRKKFVNNASSKRNLVSNGIMLVAGLFMKLWSSIISYDTELNTTHTSITTDEDTMYEEYRDELSDFAIIEN